MENDDNGQNFLEVEFSYLSLSTHESLHRWISHFSVGSIVFDIFHHYSSAIYLTLYIGKENRKGMLERFGKQNKEMSMKSFFNLMLRAAVCEIDPTLSPINCICYLR